MPNDTPIAKLPTIEDISTALRMLIKEPHQPTSCGPFTLKIAGRDLTLERPGYSHRQKLPVRFGVKDVQQTARTLLGVLHKPAALHAKEADERPTNRNGRVAKRGKSSKPNKARSKAAVH